MSVTRWAEPRPSRHLDGNGLLLGAALAAPVWPPGQPAVLVVLTGVMAGIVTAVAIAMGSGGILLGLPGSRNHRQAT
jgi:hypothetical protein